MIKNLKEYEKYIEENKIAPSIADVIGGEAADELTEMIQNVDPGTTWVEVLRKLKKEYKVSEFQSGLLMGFFVSYQAIIEAGLEVGG